MENQKQSTPFLSLDEKLKQAIQKESMLSQSLENKNFQKISSITNITDNITGSTLNPTQERKSKKIFKIKKFLKYNKILSEICSDEEVSEDNEHNPKNNKSTVTKAKKKLSPFSKTNFSKLKPEEKDERLKNLAKLVKRLRRKSKNLENKVRFNPTKLLNKYIWNKLGINYKNKSLPPEFQFDFDKICKALRKVKKHDDFEYDDHKHLIENIINLVAEDKLKLDSLEYKKICSILRTLIPKEKIKYISKKDSKITISFPETDVFITNNEYAKLKKFKDNEDILRAALGVYHSESEKVIVTVEPPELKADLNLNMNLNSNMNFNSMNPFHSLPSQFQSSPGLFSHINNMNHINNINQSNNMNNRNDNVNTNSHHILQQYLLQSYGNFFQNQNLNNSSNGSMSNINNGSNNNTQNKTNKTPNNVFIK